MRNRIIIVISIVVALISIRNFSISAGTAIPSYGFNVTIVPNQQANETYQAKLLIHDLDTNTLVAAPTILLRAGEQANTTTAGTAEGVNFKFSVKVNEKNSAVAYDISVFQAKILISRSQGEITLRQNLPTGKVSTKSEVVNSH